MNIEVAAYTLDFVGKLMIAITALLVHYNIEKEGKIDGIVIREVKLEMLLGILGIFFFASGYLLHLKFLGVF